MDHCVESPYDLFKQPWAEHCRLGYMFTGPLPEQTLYNNCPSINNLAVNTTITLMNLEGNQEGSSFKLEKTKARLKKVHWKKQIVEKMPTLEEEEGEESLSALKAIREAQSTVRKKPEVSTKINLDPFLEAATKRVAESIGDLGTEEKRIQLVQDILELTKQNLGETTEKESVSHKSSTRQ